MLTPSFTQCQAACTTCPAVQALTAQRGRLQPAAACEERKQYFSSHPGGIQRTKRGGGGLWKCRHPISYSWLRSKYFGLLLINCGAAFPAPPLTLRPVLPAVGRTVEEPSCLSGNSNVAPLSCKCCTARGRWFCSECALKFLSIILITIALGPASLFCSC